MLKVNSLGKNIFTARRSSCGKVKFSQACVKNSVRGVSHDIRPRQTHTPRADTPSPFGYYGIRSTSARYASYWNAFLSTYFLANSVLSLSGKMNMKIPRFPCAVATLKKASSLIKTSVAYVGLFHLMFTTTTGE